MYRVSESARDELSKIHKQLELTLQSAIRLGNLTEADRMLRMVEGRLSKMLDRVEVVPDGDGR